MTEHGGTRKPGREIWIGGAATAVVLIAGCCIGGRLLWGARDSTSPVSAPEYASVLAEADTSVRAPFAALGRDKAAYQAGADGLRAAADTLDGTVAPEAVAGMQESLSGSLRSLADTVERADVESPDCPAADPRTTILQSADAERVRANAAKIKDVDPAYAFGSFLPAAPKKQNRRAANGTFVTRPSGSGAGELVIESGKGRGDTTVSLVGKAAKKPAFVVYVRSGGKRTVADIRPGTYRVFVASGTDWNAERKGFTRDCSFTKFDDDFTFQPAGTRWTITLTTQAGANAGISGVDPGEFPAG